MHISIEQKKSTFNVALSSKEGTDPFIVIRGCRLMSRNDGSGDFVAWPSQKGQDGKYFNYVYANDKFAEAVLAKVKEAKRSEQGTGPADDDFPF